MFKRGHNRIWQTIRGNADGEQAGRRGNHSQRRRRCISTSSERAPAVVGVNQAVAVASRTAGWEYVASCWHEDQVNGETVGGCGENTATVKQSRLTATYKQTGHIIIESGQVAVRHRRHNAVQTGVAVTKKR